MTPKRGIFKRSVSGILAAVMVFGLVAGCLPGLVTETNAAEDTAAQLPSYHVNNRHRKDGLYLIRSQIADNLVMDIGANASGTAESAYILDYASQDPSQRFVIQIDQNASGTELGYDATTNTDSAFYGVRSATSTLWMHTNAENNVRQRYNDSGSANYRDDYGRWKFVHNGDGTVSIILASTADSASPLYVYASGSEVGNYYLKTGVKPAGDLPDNYKWTLEQTHMQDADFVTGTYWLETRVGTTYGNATTGALPASVVTMTDGTAAIAPYRPATEIIPDEETNQITPDANSAYYESQHFVIQKISGGFYSIVNVSTGRYLAMSGSSVVDGQLSKEVPNPQERWIIYPGTYIADKTATPVQKMRIISAADGRQLSVSTTALTDGAAVLNVTHMINTAQQDWFLKDIRLDVNNKEKGDTQTTNTGVYADTFDTGSTVTLPIKIFDYAADGMLFEYASLDTAAEYGYLKVADGEGDHIITGYNYLSSPGTGSYNLNADGAYVYVGPGNGQYVRDPIYEAKAGGNYIKYRLGCNLGFSMLSCSKGGTLGADWSPTSYQNGLLLGYTPQNAGNGSASFGYNKYYCPFISELRLLYEANTAGKNPELNLDLPAYERVINDYVLNGQYDQVLSNNQFKPIVLVTAGTMNTASAGIDYSKDTYMEAALGYKMIGQQTFGQATLGLLESGLETVTVNGKTYMLPRYRQEAVEYIAMVLQRSLEINYRAGDGVLNYNYVDGETSFADLASGLDLAALLRGDTKVNPGVTSADPGYTGVLDFYNSDGSNCSEGEDKLQTTFTRYGAYAETKAKSAQLIGTWANVKDHINTCMDAAYWMLNSIFLEDSYNQPQDRYHSLILTKVTDQNGKTGYIFDSTFINSSSSEAGNSAVEYNSATGTIRNTSAAGKSYTYWGTGSSAATYPFTPVRKDAQDVNGNVLNGDGDAENPKGIQTGTQSPYKLDGGVVKSQVGNTEAEYDNANYNFVLQSNAYFVYHEDEQLFFEFEGDDDVYLFINGELVLDIGAAHAVTGTKMNLNDYVNWARETLKTDPNNERAQKLALVEGDTYSFDFYYMERHGWGSNMRIFTNFQLASGEIEAAKSAQQGGEGLSYGSVVDEQENVEYTFTLKNTGTANLVMPTFHDADIGVTVSYETGLTVAEGCNGVTVFDKDKGTLEFSDLVFAYQKVGSDETAQTYRFTTLEAMTKWLTHELVIDRYDVDAGTYGVLTVGGIYYHLTNEQILEGAFHNEVEVSAYVRNDGHSLLVGEDGGPLNVATGAKLYDSAEFSVFLLSRPLYYHWRDNELKITLADILAEVQPAAKDEDNPLSNLVKPTITAITNVRLTDDTGAVGESPNSYVDDVCSIYIDEEFSIFATYKETGVKLIHLTIDYTYTTKDEDGQTVTETATATIPVQIFVLDVAASVYVLDYGLRVELSFAELTDNDVVTVDGRNTAVDVLGVTNEVEENLPVYLSRANATEKLNSIVFNSLSSTNGIWTVGNTDTVTSYDGTFTVAGGVSDPNAVLVTYTPKEFLENRDEIYIALRVREADYIPGDLGDTDIRNEVEMFKKITVLPANVMYYEDDFASIKYKTPVSQTPTGEHGKPQQSSQSEQYGHDGNAYSNSTDVTMSGGTITEITLGEAQTSAVDAATFTFQGTGFELISRTNAQDSAMIRIKVEGNFADGTTVKYYPIITQFDHISTTGNGSVDTDEVYQVPVFRLTDLPYGTFKVTVTAIPTYGFTDTYEEYVKPTKLYIDGVRIYNPLADGATASEYADQAGSVFTELRTLIFDGQAAAIGLTNNNGVPTFNTAFGHLSYTEDLNGWYNQYSGNLQQYAIAGPNNEVYMSSGDAIVLFVKQTGSKGLLHIGVHDLHDGDFYGETGENQNSAIRYWTKDEQWSADISIGMSGTEQYYPIDYSNCPVVTVDGETYYQVAIQVSSGMVSFTNVKTVGLSFVGLKPDSAYMHYRYVMGELQASADGENWTAVQAPVVATLLTMKTILQSNAQAPDEGDNPGTGDTDFLWTAVVIGLCSVVCLVPLIRKGGRA